MKSSLGSFLRKRGHLLLYFVVCCLILSFGFALDRLNAKNAVVDLRISLIEKGATLRAQLERELIGKILMSRGLVVAVITNPGISQSQFSEIAEQLKRNNPDIINIAAAPDMVVKLVYPYAENSAVIGFDYRSSEAQLTSVEMAQETGMPIVSGPVNLIQGGTGFIIRTPVFISDEESDSESFWGIVSIVVDDTLFYKNAGLLDGIATANIALRGHDGKGAQGAVIFGDEATFSTDPVILPVALPYGSWQLALAPKGGWPLHADNYLKTWRDVILFGSLFLFLLVALRNFWVRKEEAEQQLVQAIESIDDGFALYDEQDRFVMCNSKYRQIYAKTADMFRPGVPFEDIIREGVRRGQYSDAIGNETEWIRKRLEDHRAASSVVVQQLENERWLKISERKTPNGSTVGFRVDISELMLARNSAERANNEKTNFINNISHELRTPLTVILGYNSFLAKPEFLPSHKILSAALENSRSKKDDLKQAIKGFLDDVVNYAGQMNTAGQHLLALINDILDISKIEEGKMELNRQRIDVDTIVKSVAEQFKHHSGAKKIEIFRETHNEFVLADETRLRQTLINLVGNAIKFTDRGFVKIYTKAKGDFVHFYVEDTGVGITEKDQKTLFQRFSQIDSSVTRSFGGTGLGLSICKFLVEIHGGEISVVSTYGVGSTFSFSIPSWTEIGEKGVAEEALQG
ncbi:ATP-binding protein [Pseudohalocynthiibacter aestuariivivens]|uniref:histidine kinase n=1 Tax=Pseudohalocynthiibacter aestuariivivens TaxID=1591409 RepID=A0ABV5JFI7_9RHOB|nr:ATP-binding protein [Pseudohalocynthiibacter aestuariivivens]MBS9716439.1 PAS-domain containing protein [Pseudohalocynthiibacter aestuariivivens]